MSVSVLYVGKNCTIVVANGLRLCLILSFPPGSSLVLLSRLHDSDLPLSLLFKPRATQNADPTRNAYQSAVPLFLLKLWSQLQSHSIIACDCSVKVISSLFIAVFDEMNVVIT